MTDIREHLRAFGMEGNAAVLIRSKDGVAVYRISGAGDSHVLKTYENESDRREIENYRILQSLGIPTLQIIASTGSALLMEDVDRSETLRLGRRDDMDDPAVAIRLAEWYRELHGKGKAYVARHGQGMYDETDGITQENLELIAAKTGTEHNPVWAILRENFDSLRQAITSAEQTLTYNDFYFTNLIVAKDLSAALMFDYNLLGKGYAYADLRNVTSSLGDAAGKVFLRAYGGFDPHEIAVDAVASVLACLHLACQRERFPDWAQEERMKVKNGALEQAVCRLLWDAPYA